MRRNMQAWIEYYSEAEVEKVVRGFRTKYLCKCGGRVKMTIMQSKLVCGVCNKDYGYAADMKKWKYGLINNRWSRIYQ